MMLQNDSRLAAGGVLKSQRGLALGGVAVAAALWLAMAQSAFANAVIPTSTGPGNSATTINDYQQVNFAANDDGTWPCGGSGNNAPPCPGPQGQTAPTPFPVGFQMNFYGTKFNTAYINNNGNITFDGYLSVFTPSLSQFGSPIIAPFFADVDTEDVNSAQVNFGTGSLAGRKVFVVNWPGVGCYAQDPSPLDNFQLILIDRADRATTAKGDDFDIEFNYDTITWDTGIASTGNPQCVNANQGNSAYVGFSNGSSANTFNLPGSGTSNAFLDTDPSTGLIHNDVNSTTLGRYVFSVNNGQPAAPTSLSTSLSGANQSGSSISVASGTAVTDQGTLSGSNAGTATGTVTYNVYSDSSCTNLVSGAGPETIITPGTLPASQPVSLVAAGSYHWQVVYSGDTTNDGSTSTCAPSAAGDEVETVTALAPPGCHVSALIPGPPEQEQVTVQAAGGLASVDQFSEINGTHSVQAFTAGTTGPVVVTETKLNQRKTTIWSFHVSDMRGQTKYCH